MNANMQRWIREAITEMDGEFTAKSIREKIVEKRGTSPYIGNNTAIGWYLNKHCTDLVQICKGHSSNTYRRTTNDD